MTGPRGSRAGPGPHDRPARRRSPTCALAVRARGVAAAVLLGLGCLLLPVSVAVSWARGVTFDTDRYVATVAPLARDRAVQDAVVRHIARALEERADGGTLTADLARWLRAQGVPPRTADAVRSLGPRLGPAFDESLLRVVRHVMHSEPFADAWAGANRTAHRTFLRVLDGRDHGAVEVADGTVTLDLGKLLVLLRRELAGAGLPQAAEVPAIDREVVLVRPERLGRIEAAARLLDTGHRLLPALTAALGLTGLLLARGRRTVVRTALGTVLGCLLVGAAVLLLRERFLDRVPGGLLPRPAAAAAFDTTVRSLRDALTTVALVAAGTAAGAVLTGPGRRARALRAAVRRAGAGARRRAGRAPVRRGRWATGPRPGPAGPAAPVVPPGAGRPRSAPGVVLALRRALAPVPGVLTVRTLLTALGRAAAPPGTAAVGEAPECADGARTTDPGGPPRRPDGRPGGDGRPAGGGRAARRPGRAAGGAGRRRTEPPRGPERGGRRGRGWRGAGPMDGPRPPPAPRLTPPPRVRRWRWVPEHREAARSGGRPPGTVPGRRRWRQR
ncbi:hypothetical protein IHE55_27255 [Streptomyces pactum]|uniref:Integral membrane protein n=1 Tax=Streptomyces pactum TaxID=68249 RepID=A0ABS0NSW7_9ACTN|nr:hypothetical protein [Streptomyces pactum]MBH5338283.1 hypothetical protein [Streptomyces pactum]